MFLVLVIRHEYSRVIFIFGLAGSTIFFHIISQKSLFSKKESY